MTSSIEREYYNQLLPLGNTPATRGMFQVPANPTGGVVDLNTVWGPTGGAGHFLEMKAMGVATGGVSIHVAFSNSPTYTIGFGQMGGTGGNYTGVGWPILHGETIRGRVPLVGVESSPTLAGYTLTGYRATLLPAPYLHYRTPAGVATGAVLHVRQATLDPSRNAGDPGGFPAAY